MQKDQTQNIKQAQIEQPQKKVQEKQIKQQHVVLQEEIPDHFYDSDLASVNEKDFLSDNEPPKDMIQERKLLYKQKMLHVFKTIVRIGEDINKPARYDRISLKYKQVPAEEVVPKPLKKKDQEIAQQHPKYFSTMYLMDQQQIQYNLGKDHLQIQRLVISMKKGETAVFQLEHLQRSQKSNLKIRTKVEVYVISVREWTTVIDLDCDGRFMKEVIRKGEGHSRISKHDEVSFEFNLKQGQKTFLTNKYTEPVKLQDNYLDKMPNILWKILNSMKSKQYVKVIITDQVMRQFQGQKYQKIINVNQDVTNEDWNLFIQIFYFHSIDDVHMNGQLLKKTILKGVSTARPDHSSLVYFALRFLGKNREVLHQDSCFESDWWEDLGKLDVLGCRKNYLDDHSISEMLRDTIQRMKPAQIAEIQCRDKRLFAYGQDYEEYKKWIGTQQLPETVFLVVRLYNFSEGKNCFNMQIEEKIAQARRKKNIGIKKLNNGQYEKAKEVFENILSFFGTGKINQQAYDQKVSALMNCTLCLLKTQEYAKMLPLCNEVLQQPRHGYDPDKMKIRGPGHAKIQGKLPQEAKENEQREIVELNQNKKIIDKCLYRKALALTKMGEGAEAIECLKKMEHMSEQAHHLLKEAQKMKEKYEKKTVKMFKNMFG